jgi:hypothetical protein
VSDSYLRGPASCCRVLSPCRGPRLCLGFCADDLRSFAGSGHSDRSDQLLLFVTLENGFGLFLLVVIDSYHASQSAHETGPLDHPDLLIGFGLFYQVGRGNDCALVF